MSFESMRGLSIKDEGADNRFEIADSARFINSEIVVKGAGNLIKISAGSVLSGCRFNILSDSNFIDIAAECRVTANVVMKLTNGNGLSIGLGTSIGGCNFICGEGCSVKIGADCMLAWGLEVRTTDSHAILVAETGQRINFGQDINIADHVWIGAHATILKGAKIAKDSIVSIRSVVTGIYEEPGVILGGVPAKVLRTGVTWARPLLG
ncbi:acyltransferase [Cupriavidus sp. BIS7]|uniref:acyltransferase n=1 Tax=Cupriavidus sp. BIS7 TaxID=1217718 RepID=UPI00037433E4|nr:acyltransferase [Cupriavidus sp. BIS7]